MLRLPESAGGEILEAGLGKLMHYYGTVDPKDALICDGRIIKYVDYPELVEHLNTVAQTGNPRNDIAIPDLRGMFLRGVGGNSGKMNTVQENAIINITGSAPWETKYFYGSDYRGALYEDGPDTGRGVSAGNDYNNCRLFFDASRVVPTANEIRPVNVAYNIVIGTGRIGKKSDKK